MDFAKDMRTTGTITSGLALAIALAAVYLAALGHGTGLLLAIIAAFLSVTTFQIMKGHGRVPAVTYLLILTLMISIAAAVLYSAG